MVIDSILLRGFRNYADAVAGFDRGINVISGKNAQGKTNLLEALYILCTGKSFRARSDKELMGFESMETYVEARGQSGDRDKHVELILRRGRRREMLVNSVKMKTAQAFSGSFAAVLFCPEDLNLIRGGASERRRLMDMCISQLKPRYNDTLREFTKAYESKTRLLKDAGSDPSLLPLLEEYNRHLAQLSAILIHYRAAFVEKLSPTAARIHAEFSGGEDLSVRYTTVKTIPDPLRPPAELLGPILEHQAKHFEAELASGLILTGAHKDELEIEINGSAARTYASQGQTRTAALSLKLAELDIHRQSLGEYPLLLLDDVLSELDESRQDFILNRIGGGQVFITCCEDEKVASRTGGKVITVDSGTIS